MKHQALDNSKQIWAETAQDDISVLSRLVALPELQYQDINQQQQLADIEARWPLLTEYCLTRSDAS
ncbi:cellulose biosynthesis protein BcsR [Oceanisphaera sp.]|uniref:cellulose biosynthesis protein BcsR n=1 Tax=Oceanisphaera sp. TaxID=1929979 RepID=UPI003A8D6023